MAKKITKKAIKTTNTNANKAVKTITVKNTEGAPDTTAEIVIQNKISYTPKVSVIIPVYNVENYLRQCLDSVCGQTLKEIEIICIDDGSTDTSLDILKEYAKNDNRITVITQKNLHAGVARNAGLAVAKGDYVHFLDADDWLDTDSYQQLVNITNKNNIDFIKFKSFAYHNIFKSTYSWPFTDLANFPSELFDKIISFEKNFKELLEVLDAPWNGLYNRLFLVDKKLYFDNLICANDTSFFYRCLVNSTKIYVSSQTHVYYRTHNNTSLIGIRAKHFDCQLTQYNIIDKIIAQQPKDVINLVRKKLITSIVERARSYITNPAYDEDIKLKIFEQVTSFFSSLKEEITPNTNIDFYYTHLKNDSSEVKVSIIIPVYNMEKYLEQCLDSVVNQTLKEIEIICVDDGSTDNSVNIIKSYAANDSRIKLIQQKNQFAGPARNNGLKLARGEYVAFIDPDDWIDTNMYYEMYNQAKQLKSDIVVCNYEKYNENSKQFSSTPFFTELKNGLNVVDSNIPENKNISPETMRKSLMIFPCYSWNKIYKNSLLKIHDIKFDTCQCYEDWNFVLKSHMKAIRFSYIDKCYYKYRYHESSTLRTTRNNRYVYIIDLLSQIKQYLKSENIPQAMWDNFDFFVMINIYWVWLDAVYIGNETSALKTTIKQAKKLIQQKHLSRMEELLNSSHRIFYKKALIVELNPCHGECIPGYAKYLNELGYNVDVMVHEDQKAEEPLKSLNNVKIYYRSEPEILKYLNTKQPEKYEIVLFNSNIIYSQRLASILDLIKIKYQKTKVLCVEHRLENLPSLIKKCKAIVIKSFKKTSNTFEVNPHYFGEFKKHEKNKIINFVVAGNIQKTRKNYDLLTNAVQTLVNKNITNFKITVIGSGNLGDIPESVRGYFDIKGRVSYPDLYKYVSDADFFMTLLDPTLSDHDRYLNLGTSGSFQLIYGLNIPCLIANKFAKCHHFSAQNAIIYNTNDELSNAMMQAIDMTTAQYDEIKNNLKNTASKIYQSSLNNLRAALADTPKPNKKKKQYLLFPYYLCAKLYLKLVKLPALKFKKHTKSVIYSHSHRGKRSLLNEKFNKLMQAVSRNNSDTTNQISQIKKQQEDILMQISEIAATLKQIVDDKNPSKARKDIKSKGRE